MDAVVLLVSIVYVILFTVDATFILHGIIKERENKEKEDRKDDNAA